MKGNILQRRIVLIFEAEYGNMHINDRNSKGKNSYRLHREELKERYNRQYCILCFLDSLLPTTTSMRYALFRNVTQCMVAIPYQSFRTVYRSRDVGKELPTYSALTFQTSAYLIYFAAQTSNHVNYEYLHKWKSNINAKVRHTGWWEASPRHRLVSLPRTTDITMKNFTTYTRLPYFYNDHP